jgi:hypothetical protein
MPSARAVSISFHVEQRQHRVEDADVGALETKSGQPRLAVADPEGVESGLGQVGGHASCDQLVVLDDQDLAHRQRTLHVRGAGKGRSLVKAV